VTLADGTILRVEAVTVGTNHQFRTGLGVLGRLTDRLPAPLRSMLGSAGYVTSQTTRRDVGYLWLTQFDPVTQAYVRPAVHSVEVLDEDGQVFSMGASGSGGSGNYQERHIRLDFFPRRAERFRVRLKYQGRQHELTVPNPVAGEEYPEWTGAPLPQTQTANGFDYTLERMDVNHWEENRYYFRPRFVVAREGEDRTAWWDRSVYYGDATGNRRHSGLSLLESAWKLEVNFFPSVRFPFESDQVHSLGLAPAPQPGEYVLFEVDKTLRLKGVNFAALTGPGRYSIRNGKVESAEAWEEGMSGSGSSSSGSGDWQWDYSDKKIRLALFLKGPSRGAELMPPMHDERHKLLARAREADGKIREGKAAPAGGRARTTERRLPGNIRIRSIWPSWRGRWSSS
jgi:hypothetical protein